MTVSRKAFKLKSLLKNAREAKGFKIREVAETLNIDMALVSKFESGHRRPTKDQVIKLAALLEIDLDTIMILWLKEKILSEIANESLGLQALKAAEMELNPTPNNNPNLKALDSLFEEMEALRNKMENLRNDSNS